MEVRLERATRLPRPPWWVAALVLLWVGLIAFTSSAFFGPPDAPTTCHFRALTSVPCAGCGGARGARMILDGRPAAAFDLNPGLFALLTVWGALFLRRFTEPGTRYLHFDIYGWQPSGEPTRPKGGVGQGTRALFQALPQMLDL